MIGISTTTFDLQGARVFHDHDEPVLSSMNRRVSRTATLDCDVSIYDGGICDGDRKIVVGLARPTDDDVAFCEYICRYYGEVIVSCPEGAFRAVPVSTNETNGKFTLTLYIKEKFNG